MCVDDCFDWFFVDVFDCVDVVDDFVFIINVEMV